MENKREIIVKKVDKFVFNVKHLNAIIAVFFAMFVAFFFVCYSKEKVYIAQQNETYQRLMDEIAEHQLNIIYSNVTPNDGYIDTTKEAEKPKFKDAKEAVVFAFDLFNKYSSYEIVCSGVSYSEAMGQTVEVKNDALYVKFDDGIELEQSCRIETKTNFGQSGAEENVFKDGKKYQRKGSNLKLQNNKATAEYSGNYTVVNSKLTNIPFHIVNENTVKFKNSFSFVREKNNKIAYYKASVSLDAEASTIYFGENVKEQGGTSFPVFSKVELSCIIDRDGNLLSFEFNDDMVVTKRVVIDINAKTRSSLTFTLVSHDQTPTIAKPQI